MSKETNKEIRRPLLADEETNHFADLCFDSDPEIATVKYEQMRRKLRKFFEWNRCEDPDELVDKCFDRAAHKIKEGGDVLNITNYLQPIAYLVLKESWSFLDREAVRPDQFFTVEQQQRLSELMQHWRDARDKGTALPPDEQAELESLIEAEIEAAKLRAEVTLSELSK